MAKKNIIDKRIDKRIDKQIDKNIIKILPLVPAYILMPLWLISLVMPNLVYSGIKFADTLHILKWTVTGVPIAIAVIVAGIRLFIYGRERINLKIDLFAVIWALMLAYASVQCLWVKIFSPTGYVLELVCVLTIWAFYVISILSFPEWGLRPVLFLASINAALNVLFAELQIRNMNNLAFLEGTIFEDLRNISSIILPTPGNYIGNTAQQNMFGLWTAICTLGTVYLFVYDIWKSNINIKENIINYKKIFMPVINIVLIVICLKFALSLEEEKLRIIFGILTGILFILLPVIIFKLGNDWRLYFSSLNLLLMCANFWGLLNSTSRSGFLAFVTGMIMLFIISIWKFGKNYFIRFAAVMIILAAVFSCSYTGRAEGLINKTADIVQNASDVGGRIGIWMTSYSMFKEHPEGVGTGQFKWHYLEAQREGFKTEYVTRDWYEWQYTHWAHNEFLQWFCEGGWIGGIILIIMYFVWFIPALIGLFKEPKYSININSVWGLALVSLISFAALFTRPFHRIENMVWITLAFAMSNRYFFNVKSLSRFKLNFNIIKSNIFCKILGVICVCASIVGCVYIWGGIRGNYLLRQAMLTQNPGLQIYLLNEADKYSITHEEAQRNIGLHYLQLGEQTNDSKTIEKGFNILWEHFQREPHSEDISRLLNLSQRFQVENVLRELASYFKPGAYKLVRRPMQTSDGKIINALMLINAKNK